MPDTRKNKVLKIVDIEPSLMTAFLYASKGRKMKFKRWLMTVLKEELDRQGIVVKSLDQLRSERKEKGE